MLVAETTENDVAAVPPKDTAVAPVRFVPVIVTVIPDVPDTGLKEVMVGGVEVLNTNPANVPVPPAVVTDTLPDVPVPTVAVMVVAFTTVNDVAAVPPNETAVAPVKFVPFMVTVAPAAAAVGVKDVIVGAATKVNSVNEPFP
jgi:hypothetical protein